MAPHPLFRRRPPGKKAADARPEIETCLQDAAQVLALVEEGELVTSLPPIPNHLRHACRQRRPPRLTADEERLLAERVQKTGDIEARNILVVTNMGLVWKIARQMATPNVPAEELAAEGVLGIIRATETYDGTKSRFSTYASEWIFSRMQRCHRRESTHTSAPLVGAPSEGRKPGETRRHERRTPRATVRSLDEPIVGSEVIHLHDVVPGPSPSLTEHREACDVRRRVATIALRLARETEDPRVVLLVVKRFLAEEPLSLAEVGKLVDLSRERIRHLENRLKLALENELISLGPDAWRPEVGLGRHRPSALGTVPGRSGKSEGAKPRRAKLRPAS